MLRKSIFFFFLALLGFVVSVYAENPRMATPVRSRRTLTPTPKQMVACKNITQYLLQKSFRKFATKDSLSLEIFNRYLTNLDGEKNLFVATEVDSLRKIYGTRILDQCLAGNVNAGFAIYNLFLRRTKEKIHFMHNSLAQSNLNFSTQETLDRDHKNGFWSADRSELSGHWTKEFKYWWLNFLYAGETNKTIRLSLAKSLTELENNMNHKRSDDAFQAYIYAVSTSFDPHTNYFSPDKSENFRIEMSHAVEGIGIKMDASGPFTVITDVIPGGSAFRSHQLKKGDKIIGVSQGITNKITDVFGWRAEDIGKLIRGRKGTTVDIKIFPAGQGVRAQAKVVRLVREKINLEDELAQKSIIQANGFKVGVISIPSFYLDFDGREKKLVDYRSVSNDVTRILNELKAEHVDGIVIDLLNNRGGALEEAVRLTGLFVQSGPVVQIVNSSGRVELLNIDQSIQQPYNGPIAVLVNRLSASASEIFAAAIQDYGRGIIVGERTFGKGTVQSIDKLSQQKASSELGEVKLTTAKFYRISGGSTQHVGVIPDIIIPSLMDNTAGENSYKSSLPWSTISPALYSPTAEISPEAKSVLQNMYMDRASKDPLLQNYLYDVTVLDKIHKKTAISLQNTSFKSELLTIQQIKKKYRSRDIMINEAAKVVIDQKMFRK